MAIFGPKAWANHFGKMSKFLLFELLVFIFQKGVFPFQNIIIKEIFLAYIAKKKKLEKCPFLIFSSFKISCFYTIEKRFSVLEYHKRYFSGVYSLNKKKLEKWPFLDQKHGLTPFKKCYFFVFLNFLFLQPRKSLFPSRIS